MEYDINEWTGLRSQDIKTDAHHRDTWTLVVQSSSAMSHRSSDRGWIARLTFVDNFMHRSLIIIMLKTCSLHYK